MQVVQWDCAVHCTLTSSIWLQQHAERERERGEEWEGSSFFKQSTPPSPRAEHHMFLRSEIIKKNTQTLELDYFDFTHRRTQRLTERERGTCARLRSSPKQTVQRGAVYQLRTSKKEKVTGSTEEKKPKKTPKTKCSVKKNSKLLTKCCTVCSCASRCCQSFVVFVLWRQLIGLSPKFANMLTC